MWDWTRVLPKVLDFLCALGSHSCAIVERSRVLRPLALLCKLRKVDYYDASSKSAWRPWSMTNDVYAYEPLSDYVLPHWMYERARSSCGCYQNISVVSKNKDLSFIATPSQ